MILPRVFWAPPREDDSTARKDDPSVGMFEYRPLVSPVADPFYKQPDPQVVRPATPAPQPPAGAASPAPSDPAPVVAPAPEPSPSGQGVMPPTAREVFDRQARDHFSIEVPQGREHSTGNAAVVLSGEQYLRQRIAPTPPPQHDPLEEIYGKPRRTATSVEPPPGFEPTATSHRVGGAPTRMTMREGTPPKAEAHEVLSPWIWTLIRFVIAALVLATLLGVPMKLTTVDGQTKSVSLGWWLIKQVVMSSEERLVQGLPPADRPMALTVHRAKRAHAALMRYYTMNGTMPTSILQLSEQRFIESDKLVDGWDRLFEAEYLNTRPVIRSSGSNGLFRDHDDVVVDEQGVRGL